MEFRLSGPGDERCKIVLSGEREREREREREKGERTAAT